MSRCQRELSLIGYPLIIVLIAFAVILRYAFADYALVSDAETEFMVYSSMAETGKWGIVANQTLLSSCLFTTFFPALFQRTFNTDLVLTYKLFPSFIVPFLPVVVYFLAKKWTSPFYAFLASAFVMGQIYFLWALSFSRIMVALVFFSLALLVIFDERFGLKAKIGWAMLFALCMVTAHYGVTFGTLGAVGIVIVTMLVLKGIRRYHYPNLKAMSAFWVVLLVGTIVWLGIINTYPLACGKMLVLRSLKIEPPRTEVVSPPLIVNPSTTSPPMDVVKIPIPVVEKEEYGFFSLESRETVIQAAFGKTLPIMNIPQKIEFALSWLTILMVTWGLAITTWRYRLGNDWVLLMLTCYGIIVVSVILPEIGLGYGIARVYFHMVIVLASCFIIGGKDVAKRIRVPAPVVLLTVLILYGLSTSGVTHILFGLAR